MAWVLRLVETEIDDPARVIDVMDIRPLGALGDIANLGLTLSEAKQILARLQQGPLRVTELAAPFDMSLNAVSKHVKVLEGAGLVRRTRAGREHHIALDPEPIRRIAGWASRYERFWSDRLDKLEAFLKANRKRD